MATSSKSKKSVVLPESQNVYHELESKLDEEFEKIRIIKWYELWTKVLMLGYSLATEYDFKRARSRFYNSFEIDCEGTSFTVDRTYCDGIKKITPDCSRTTYYKAMATIDEEMTYFKAFREEQRAIHIERERNRLLRIVALEKLKNHLSEEEQKVLGFC